MPINALVGYDGSPAANAAIDAGASLFPKAHASITYIWGPPFASSELRERLRTITRDADELIETIEREGEHEARKLLSSGVTLAGAAGWDAEPLLQRTWGGEGLRIPQAAEDVQADVVLVGSRGLGGSKAVLGSVSDLVVHYSSRPTVVIRKPMLEAEYAALTHGPVVVGWDGSVGATAAFAAAARLFPERDLMLVCVDEGADVVPPPDLPETAGRRVELVRVDAAYGFAARRFSDALIASARARNAAVVVVGSRGRSAVREILLGSVAMGTLHRAYRPVMVVPN